jgi:hypothetical protein
VLPHLKSIGARPPEVGRYAGFDEPELWSAPEVYDTFDEAEDEDGSLEDDPAPRDPLTLGFCRDSRDAAKHAVKARKPP